MKKITVISLALVLLASLTLLTACANAADKAYETWNADNIPKEKAANEEFAAAFKPAQEQGDRAGQVAAIEKYLSVIKPIREQLAAIDMAKLSDKYKSAYEAELARIDESIKGIEENLAIQKDILAEEQGGAPVDEQGAPAEEPVANDEEASAEEEADAEE